MIEMLKLFNLGKLGLDYFSNNYKLYIDYIELMEKNNIYIKNIYLALPSKSSKLDSIDQFRYGTSDKDSQLYEKMKKAFPRLRSHFQTMHALFSEFIEQYSITHNGCILYINEFNFRSSTIDSDRKKCKAKVEWKENYIMMKEQIIYYIKGAKLDKREVFDTIIYAHGLWPPYDIGFVSSYFTSSQKSTDEDIIKIIKGIKMVFIGAYDGEGILIGEVEEGDFIETFDKLNIPYTYE